MRRAVQTCRLIVALLALLCLVAVAFGVKKTENALHRALPAIERAAAALWTWGTKGVPLA